MNFVAKKLSFFEKKVIRTKTNSKLESLNYLGFEPQSLESLNRFYKFIFKLV
jgi:hypothetical protein